VSTKVSPARGKFSVRKLTMTAMLGAVATVLMFISFSVPLMPSFIKLDLSELPALIASFALGPWSGVVVCLIKNLINLFFSTTGGVGELSNFILGAAFVFTAGAFYRRMGGRKGALIGSLCGAAMMAVISVFSNYYVVYPVYSAFMPMETILGMYQAINPHVDNLWDALIWFNMPFTFLKGMLSVVITFLIYKKISPLLKGTKA
jgi:riboflavin transporter FmnP